ncbi:MAG: GTPase [Thermoprotei archaeon]|nr:MAG: GTPase [Thermoprotei archaeon]
MSGEGQNVAKRSEKKRKRVIIMGAGGRDFHNFNVYFRNNPEYEVVAFTAAQIPGIEGRVYPPELAGPLYPNGIPIYSEEKLPELVRKYDVDEVILAYSDLTFKEVMEKASRVLALGADFKLLGVKSTMLKSSKPVIAVCATRTGAGKSTTSRKIIRYLLELGVNPVVIRHPMAYGDLRKKIIMRITDYSDLDRYGCTIEEREEFEQYIELGITIYAGVDYEKVLKEAEKEGDVILWDGGNNDFPFIEPDLWITVVDPLRPGQEVESYPGAVNVILAHVIVVNKVNTAPKENINKVIENVRRVNPGAKIVLAESRIIVDHPELIKGKRVVVVEDFPSVTHGCLSYGAGYIAATQYGAAEVVDPKPYATGLLKKIYEQYPQMGPVVPSLGYGEEHMRELEELLNRIPCDTIILGTPSNIARYLKLNKPVVRVKCELHELSEPTLRAIIEDFISKVRRNS